MSTDILFEVEKRDNDVKRSDADTKDMDEIELVITDEDVREIKDDPFCKAQEEDGDKRSSSNTSGILNQFTWVQHLLFVPGVGSSIGSEHSLPVEVETEKDEKITTSSPEEPKKQSWLLRLFESKLFDSSMAMTYMFNCKEPGVLEYIANKLFSFDESEVDFYLPQLINMYIMMHAVAEVSIQLILCETPISTPRLFIPTLSPGVVGQWIFHFKQPGYWRLTAVMPTSPQRKKRMEQGCETLFLVGSLCQRS